MINGVRSLDTCVNFGGKLIVLERPRTLCVLFSDISLANAYIRNLNGLLVQKDLYDVYRNSNTLVYEYRRYEYDRKYEFYLIILKVVNNSEDDLISYTIDKVGSMPFDIHTIKFTVPLKIRKTFLQKVRDCLCP